MAKKKDVMLDHDYDGIKELDNDLPPWWVYMFYVTIVVAVVYMLHYHVFETGDLMMAEYNKEINPDWVSSENGGLDGLLGLYHSPYNNPKGDVTPYIKKQFAAFIGQDVGSEGLIMEAMRRSDAETFEKLKSSFPDLYKQLSEGGAAITPKASTVKTAPIVPMEALTDAASLSAGKNIFVKNCVSCHGAEGQGGIGPNMTDDYWIHGADMAHIANIITVGVPAKGMITWRGVLKEEEIKQVSSYILTLHGTNPTNAKAPQGQKFEYPLN